MDVKLKLRPPSRKSSDQRKEAQFFAALTIFGQMRRPLFSACEEVTAIVKHKLRNSLSSRSVVAWVLAILTLALYSCSSAQTVNRQSFLGACKVTSPDQMIGFTMDKDGYCRLHCYRMHGTSSFYTKLWTIKIRATDLSSTDVVSISNYCFKGQWQKFEIKR
jgi:hypothetical protein